MSKTKRLRDYLPSHASPSFDAIKADLLRYNARKALWASQQIQSLYDSNRLSIQDYFRLLGEAESLGLHMTEEIQDLLENCVAARAAGFVKTDARAQDVMALHRAYPEQPIEEIVAIEEIFAGIKTGFTDASAVAVASAPHKARMRAPPKVQVRVVGDLLAEGHTQREIAERLGVHQSAVSHALRRARHAQYAGV